MLHVHYWHVKQHSWNWTQIDIWESREKKYKDTKKVYTSWL